MNKCETCGCECNVLGQDIRGLFHPGGGCDDYRERLDRAEQWAEQEADESPCSAENCGTTDEF